MFMPLEIKRIIRREYRNGSNICPCDNARTIITYDPMNYEIIVKSGTPKINNPYHENPVM